MQFGTEGHFDTQDNMLRQDVVDMDEAVPEDVADGDLLSQRLSIIKGPANEKADGSRRGSEKNNNNYKVIQNDDLEMDAKKTQAKQNTAYGDMRNPGSFTNGPNNASGEGRINDYEFAGTAAAGKPPILKKSALVGQNVHESMNLTH